MDSKPKRRKTEQKIALQSFTPSSCISGTHNNGELTFYSIADNNEIIHLTFSLESHQKALAWLRKSCPGERPKKCRLPQHIYRQIDEYLSGQRQRLTPSAQSPFLKRGTVFQKRVWRLIADIPYGETRSYGFLARRMGNIGYARAVGRACNANPIALIIPCHRVTGKQKLGGFSGGIEIKKRLLALEAENRNRR